VIRTTAMMEFAYAPLAALVALLELTNDASIILPAMFVTIPAYLWYTKKVLTTRCFKAT
jgi:CIC family chloride channel protein